MGGEKGVFGVEAGVLDGGDVFSDFDEEFLEVGAVELHGVDADLGDFGSFVAHAGEQQKHEIALEHAEVRDIKARQPLLHDLKELSSDFSNLVVYKHLQ